MYNLVIGRKVYNLSDNNLYDVYRNNIKLNRNTTLATGDVVKVGSVEYTISVLGDIDKDGKITLNDLSELRKYLVDDNTFDDSQFMAADLDSNDEISILDLVVLRRMMY